MVLYINDKLLSYGPATFYAKKWVRRVGMTQRHCLKIFSKSVKERIHLGISSVISGTLSPFLFNLK